MIRWIKNLYFRWQMYRLSKSIAACLTGGADVRELQEIGRMMHAVGEKHDIQSWREMGEEIEANAETIVLNRGLTS